MPHPAGVASPNASALGRSGSLHGVVQLADLGRRPRRLTMRPPNSSASASVTSSSRAPFRASLKVIRTTAPFPSAISCPLTSLTRIVFLATGGSFLVRNSLQTRGAANCGQAVDSSGVSSRRSASAQGTCASDPLTVQRTNFVGFVSGLRLVMISTCGDVRMNSASAALTDPYRERPVSLRDWLRP